MREPVAAIYWFARNADDIADEGEAAPEARLAASMAERGRLPRAFSVRNGNGIPVRAVMALGCIHTLSLSLAGLGVLNLASLVGTANGLFLLNALFIVCAAIRLLPNRAVRRRRTTPRCRTGARRGSAAPRLTRLGLSGNAGGSYGI